MTNFGVNFLQVFGVRCVILSSSKGDLPGRSSKKGYFEEGFAKHNTFGAE